MAPMSQGSGTAVTTASRPPRKGKLTPSPQNHRFEPFSQRILNIKVKPVRINAQDKAHSALEDDQSHFRIALEEWQERNMSTTFVELAQVLEPLCQNLPQVIHYEGQIVDALLKWLPQGNVFSLESMLALVVQLAYDIGQRFDTHLERIVRAVSSIAATSTEVEVIEWSFNCLAALFKHFERILVQKMRWLYDVLAPMMGKERQKAFVCRFTAESLSFLVRKLATAAEDSRSDVDDFVSHVFADLEATTAQQALHHQRSIMTMFADALKGVQGGLRNGGIIVLRSLFDVARSSAHDLAGASNLTQQSVLGILTALIHHSSAEGFAPALRVLLHFVYESLDESDSQRIFCANTLLVAVSVRKGTRIGSSGDDEHPNWISVNRSIGQLIGSVDKAQAPPSSALTETIQNALSVFLQYCPMADLSLAVSHISRISKGQWQCHFLHFCIGTCDLGVERFNHILQKQLESFIVDSWVSDPATICAALQYLPQDNRLASAIAHHEAVHQDFVLKMHSTLGAFETQLPIEDEILHLISQYMDIFAAAEIRNREDAAISDFSMRFVQAALNPNMADPNTSAAALALCKCLAYIQPAHPSQIQTHGVFASLFKASKLYGSHLGYLKAIQKHLPAALRVPEVQDDHHNELTNALIQNLSSSTSQLRLLSLDILAELCDARHEPAPHFLQLASFIEHSSFDFNNIRTIALNVRKLGQFNARAEVSWAGRALISYLFGLLHVRLTPLWSDICSSLNILTSNPNLQQEIVDRCMSWLGHRQPGSDDSSFQATTDSLPPVERTTEFQCTNLMQVRQVWKRSMTRLQDVPDTLRAAFDLANGETPIATAANRTQSLLVLTKLPAIAEKYSRRLVPVFLDWFQSSSDHEALVSEPDTDDSDLRESSILPSTQVSRASREDRRAMLKLFSSFLNPRVLYKADEVYSRLSHELCSGDVEIQRLALKAILTWKSPATRPYEENMMNLLDDARFRNELTVFLATEHENSVIRAEHVDELMPVLLRLLYGRSIARAKGRGEQSTRRQAILLSIARFGHHALGQFIKIALQPLDSLSILSAINPPVLSDEVIERHRVSPRMQLGYMRMVTAILNTLPNLVPPFAIQLLEVVLLCLVKSGAQLSGGNEANVEHESLVKSVRQEGFKCLELLFSRCPAIDWSNYVPPLLERVVSPRIEHLPIETAQGISTMLRLLSAWASSPQLIYILLDSRSTALTRVADCLTVPSARDEVKVFVLKDIIGELLVIAENDVTECSTHVQILATRLCGGLAELYLRCIAEVLANNPSRAVLENGIYALTQLAPFLSDSSQVDSLVATVTRSLSTGTKGIPPHLKSRLLSVLGQYLLKSRISQNEDAFNITFDTLSLLFSYFLDAPSRLLLAHVFNTLVIGRQDYATSARLCGQLNAFSSSRLEEPDYDARLEALNIITSESSQGLNARQWRPIVHNLLYSLKDDAKFSSVRTGASEGLRHFIRAGAIKSSQQDDACESEMKAIIDKDILPAVCRGMHEVSEPIQLEYLSILAELASMRYPSTADMASLLGTESRVSFFEGVLHIQQAQRLSALRLLASAAHTISSSNISRVFLPLVETFIGNHEEGSQAITDEAIKTFDALAECLEWVKYRYLLQRMVGEKNRFESKQSVRVLGAAVNALYRAHTMTMSGSKLTTALAQSLPSDEYRAEVLTKGCLSQLLEFTHFRNESTVDLRIMVAATAVKMIMTFSPAMINDQLPPVLMDLCNVLRSKAQEARDTARKTLADISAVIGPSYFGFLVKQLKSSLQRGTQLHVMSYTIHSLLVVVAPKFTPGDLDYCLQDLMAIIVDDIFGGVGQEKESEGFTSKMKEVRKKALGYNSLELLSSFTSPNCVGALIRPIKSHLMRPRPKLEKCDELLRRVQEGLRRNERFVARQALILCYEILRDSLQAEPKVNVSASPSRYKLAAFALNLVRRTIDRHESLKIKDNLQGFLPLLTQALAIGETTSMEAALRVFTSIIKLPIPELDQNAGEYMKLARQIVESDTSTSSQLSQSSLRLMSSLLRERPDAVIKQIEFTNTIAYMLKRVTPDLREPAHSHERGRQVGAYNLLKAVLGRGVLITEVYEIMDTVREVLVTSPEPEIRSSARSVYCRFVLDYYPDEGKGYVKQMAFMKSNLQYEHAHGRQSVMEVIDYLLYKKKGDMKSAQSLITRFWEALLDLLVTDIAVEGRAAARVLLVKLFQGADADTRQIISSHLSRLTDPGMADLIQRAGYRGWSAYFEANPSARQEASALVRKLNVVIATTESTMKRSKAHLFEDVLDTYVSLCERFSEASLHTAPSSVWNKICTAAAGSAQVGVRQASLQVINVYFGDFAKSAAVTLEQQGLPLIGSTALQLNRSQLLQVIASSTLVFKEAFESVLAIRASQILSTVSRLLLGDDTTKILSQIFSRLSNVIRQEMTPTKSKLMALRLLKSIAERQPNNVLQPTMQEVLMMLANLTDVAIAPAFGEEESHEQLSEVAQEFLDMLKGKLGPNDFIKQFQSVQMTVRERREERKSKRSIQTVSQPEQAGKEKVCKGAAKREKRKERNKAFAGRRRGY